MITNITKTSVSILEVRNGKNWRRAYINSDKGRAQLLMEFPDVYVDLCCDTATDADGNIIKGWWGTEPMVSPETRVEVDDSNAEPTAEEMLSVFFGV